LIKNSPLLVLFLCGCSGAEIREVAEIVEAVAPAVGSAATTVVTSGDPVTGIFVAGATLLSALLRNNLKGE
tara:strand:- start:28 stop:240 length:213 start_codon:yes stop_codon:yes gene_type:complete